MNMKRSTLAILVIATVIASSQDKSEVISGVVTDRNNGKPLKGVIVTLAKPRLSTVSDSLGRFIFENIPWGRHEIRFTFEGYLPVAFQNVPVDGDRRLPLFVSMSKTPVTQDGIKIYTPDSRIGYKIQIYDPTQKVQSDSTSH
jgi:hypothetical protein